MERDALVQYQLEAYNRRALDEFVSCYAQDAVVRHADGRVLLTGRDEIRVRYGRLFAENPDLHAEVSHRVQVGDWVVDEERVHLRDQELHAVVGYLVRSGLIDAVVMIRSDM